MSAHAVSWAVSLFAIVSCTSDAKRAEANAAGDVVPPEADRITRPECPAPMAEDSFWIGDMRVSVDVERVGSPHRVVRVGDLVTINSPGGRSTPGTSAPRTVPLRAGRRHVFRFDDVAGRTFASIDGGAEELVGMASRDGASSRALETLDDPDLITLRTVEIERSARRDPREDAALSEALARLPAGVLVVIRDVSAWVDPEDPSATAPDRPVLALPKAALVRLMGGRVREVALAPDTKMLEIRSPRDGRVEASSIPAGDELVRLAVEDIALPESDVLDLSPWPALARLELAAESPSPFRGLASTTSQPQPPLVALELRGFEEIDLSWLDAWLQLETVVVQGGRVTGLPHAVGPKLRRVTLRDVEVDARAWDEIERRHSQVRWIDDPADDVRARFECATAIEVRNRICDARNEDLRYRAVEPSDVAGAIERLAPRGAHDSRAFACGGLAIEPLAGGERLGHVTVPTCESAGLEGWAAMMRLGTDSGHSFCDWLASHDVAHPSANAKTP